MGATGEEGRVAHDKGAANLWVPISGFCDWLCGHSGSTFNIQHGPNQRISTQRNTNMGGVSISDNALVEVNEASGLGVSLRSRDRPRNLRRGSEFPSPWAEFALRGRTFGCHSTVCRSAVCLPCVDRRLVGDCQITFDKCWRSLAREVVWDPSGGRGGDWR